VTSLTDGPEAMVAAFERTAVREHMSLGDAIAYQFGLVDAIQRVMGSDEVFVEDYGQVRSLATVGFGGGGRPRATARAEGLTLITHDENIRRSPLLNTVW